jgi:mannitol/fructose-specific phosphotransferase system IIA component (Ntr-type)
MAQKLDQDELVSFRELLISNTIQLDTVSRLLIEKGIITDEEFFDKLKQVQMEYKSTDNA